MLQRLLDLVLEQLDNQYRKGLTIEDKIVQIVEEINELEIKLAIAIAEAERWGDINDNSDWRTVEVNKIKRIIESKRKMIDTLRKV